MALKTPPPAAYSATWYTHSAGPNPIPSHRNGNAFRCKTQTGWRLCLPSSTSRGEAHRQQPKRKGYPKPTPTKPYPISGTTPPFHSSKTTPTSTPHAEDMNKSTNHMDNKKTPLPPPADQRHNGGGDRSVTTSSQMHVPLHESHGPNTTAAKTKNAGGFRAQVHRHHQQQIRHIAEHCPPRAGGGTRGGHFPVRPTLGPPPFPARSPTLGGKVKKKQKKHQKQT